MRRRKFITLLGGAAAAWPLPARTQQRDQIRRIGVLMNIASDDAEGQSRNAAFLQGLAGLGWIVGRNVRIEYRWVAGDADLYRRYAEELSQMTPDILVGSGSAATSALQLTTRNIPIGLRAPPIRSAAAWSRAWRGRAATPPVLPHTSFPWPRNGWNCLSRSCRA